MMKKDKKWLKEQLSYLQDGVGESFNDYSKGLNSAYNTLERLIDQLDEPKPDIDATHDLLEENTTLSQEDFDLYWNCINDGVAVSELKQLELPTIPQFIGDYIKKAKKDITLMRVFDIAENRDEMDKWVREYDWIRGNHEIFARAWIGGYSVEKEKLYRVVLNKTDDKWILWQATDGSGEIDLISGKRITTGKKKFTEQEIKSIDERYLAFKVEVDD